ncbi:exodeoxyribonuclease VII small subunit [Falsiroseomonas sp.]|uniref:exodeoxyribonuclease VII small subunit n=1 Tax=Falsiroseomonas sp. TaxID=2870721 RepID=UPI00271A53C5|nr:exodeoxyribonuclease VII small subunit [Falsiroseomonas sp.]MDO9499102.1 exodeoxyribonuclease VII small subunit [Falsiroseomonas sp.]MDP3415713.1 exodeoxyribonuclease VII small subunit [Falsiroseomonas sp.]
MSTQPDTARPVASLSFEEALAELEGIVKDLESGKGKLEEAVAAYERGAQLRRHCEAKLAEAEAKVQAIVESPPGTATSLRDMA